MHLDLNEIDVIRRRVLPDAGASAGDPAARLAWKLQQAAKVIELRNEADRLEALIEP